MNRNRFFVLFFLFLFGFVKNVGAIEVGGDISSDAVWTISNSPYRVISNLSISNNSKLTIEGGVEVYFEQDTGLTINEGTLVAIGSNSKKVYFTSDDGSSWKGIRFNNFSEDAILDQSGIYLKGSVLKFCILENVSGRAITCEYSNPLIENNIIRNNINTDRSVNGNIIQFYKSESIKLFNNLIFNNSCTITVGNVWGSGVISNNIFSNNIESRVIYLNSGSVLVKNNDFYDNNISISLCKNTDSTSFTIQYNNFRNTYLAVQNNCNPDDVNAQNNWWGTLNTDEIDNKISDYYDRSTQGRILYSPFLIGPRADTGSDSDNDSIFDLFEGEGCTDPGDADTDDDGILDGEEDLNQDGVVDANETNPCLADTDGDGILDGTEVGLTVADVGPDTDLSLFIADEDPTTTTNPLFSDTDKDGVSDGDEDLNSNGLIEDGESDPNARDTKAMPWIPLLLHNK